MSWLLHIVLGGGLLLLLGWVLMKLTTAPARRERIGEWAVLAALLVAALSLGPGWLRVELPRRSAPLVAKQTAPPAAAEPPASSDALHRLPLAAESVAPDIWVLPTLPQPQDRSEPTARAVPSVPAPQPEIHQSPQPTTGDAARAAPSFLGSWLPGLALLAYVLTVGAFGVRWLVGILSLRRILRHAGPAPLAVQQLFDAMAPRRLRARLLLSPQVRVPFSCGLWQPTCVLPSALAERAGEEELRWVFAHELMHLQRRDAWSGMLLGLAQALYFFVPWFWWLRRQVRLCQEYIADAAAARTGQAADYAQFLVGWAPAPSAPAGVHGVTGSCSDLFRRVAMLLQNPKPPELCCSRRWSVLTGGALLGLAILVAGVDTYAAPAPAPKDAPAKKKLKKDQPSQGSTQKAPEQDEQSPFNIDDVLKMMPQNLDPEQMKALREQLQQNRHEIEKALEQLRQLQRNPNLPGAMGALAGLHKPGHTGRLGIEITPPSPTLAEQLDLPRGQGMVIEAVTPGSAAEKAGLKAHDVLLELDGKAVPSKPAALVRMVSEIKAGKTIDAVVLRKGKRETIKGLTLREAKSAQKQPMDGMEGFDGNNFLKSFKFDAGKGFADNEVWKQVQPWAAKFAPGNGVFVFPGMAGDKGVMTATFRTDDRFTTRHQEGSLVITLSGKVSHGKTTLGEIHIRDGSESHDYRNLEDVPQRYRDKVKNLMEMTRKGNAHVEVEKP